MSNKVIITAYPTLEQHTALMKLSEDSRVPFSELIREGVDMVLKDPENALKISNKHPKTKRRSNST